MRKLAVALAAALASQAAQAEPYRLLPRLAPAKVQRRARMDASQTRTEAARAQAPVMVIADAEGPINVIAIGESTATPSWDNPSPAQPDEDSATPEDAALAVDQAVRDQPAPPPAMAPAPIPPASEPATTVTAISLADLTTIVDARTPSGERVEVLADGAGGLIEIIRDRDGEVVAARNRSGRIDL